MYIRKNNKTVNSENTMSDVSILPMYVSFRKSIPHVPLVVEVPANGRWSGGLVLCQGSGFNHQFKGKSSSGTILGAVR